MNLTKITKAELAAQNEALRTENHALLRRISELEVQLSASKTQRPAPCSESIAQRYPLVDGLGRRYRIVTVRGMPQKAFAPDAQ